MTGWRGGSDGLGLGAGVAGWGEARPCGWLLAEGVAGWGEAAPAGGYWLRGLRVVLLATGVKGRAPGALPRALSFVCQLLTSLSLPLATCDRRFGLSDFHAIRLCRMAAVDLDRPVEDFLSCNRRLVILRPGFPDAV